MLHSIDANFLFFIEYGRVPNDTLEHGRVWASGHFKREASAYMNTREWTWNIL